MVGDETVLGKKELVLSGGPNQDIPCDVWGFRNDSGMARGWGTEEEG